MPATDCTKKGFSVDKTLVDLFCCYDTASRSTLRIPWDGTATQLLLRAVGERPPCLETTQIVVMLARRAYQERRGRIRSGGEKGDSEAGGEARDDLHPRESKGGVEVQYGIFSVRWTLKYT